MKQSQKCQKRSIFLILHFDRHDNGGGGYSPPPPPPGYVTSTVTVYLMTIKDGADNEKSIRKLR